MIDGMEANGQIIAWVLDNLEELSLEETFITLSAMQEMAQRLEPIYRKHNAIELRYTRKKK